MKLLKEDHNWTEEGKLAAIQFEKVLKPVFLELLNKGCDKTEAYTIATKAVFNAWMAASQSYLQSCENQGISNMIGEQNDPK